MFERNSKAVSGLVGTTFGTFFLLTGTVVLAQGIPATPIQQVAAVVPAVPQAAIPAAAFDVDRTLTEARRAIATRDLTQAERLLSAVSEHAARTGYAFREQDDQPRFVASLLEQSKKLAAEVQTTGPTEAFRRQYAQLALVQADAFLRKGELELAYQMTQEASTQGVGFSEAARQAGMEPQIIFQKIESARIARQTAATTANYNSQTDETHTQQMRDYELRIPQPTPADVNRSIVDEARQQQQIAIQQIAADIMQQIADAYRVNQDRGDVDGALTILRRAKMRLAESNIDPQTQVSFQRNIDTAIRNIEANAQRYDARAELDRANNQVLAERRAEQEESLAIQQKLKTYVEECNKCLREGRYEDAVIIAKKARDLAPEDPVTSQLVLVAQLTSRTKRYEDIKGQKEEAYVEAMMNVDKASIPWSDNVPIQFPETWAALKGRRGTDEITNNRPEAEKEILRRLEMPVSLNLDRPIPFAQAIQLLRAQSGIQIFPQESVLRDMDITSETLVHFPVTSEITLRSALNLILHPLGLAFVVENEVLNITSAALKNQSRMYPKVYYVADLIHSVPNAMGYSPYSLEGSHERAVQRTRTADRPNSNNNNRTSSAIPPLAATQPNSRNNDAILAQTNPGYTSFGAPQNQGDQSGANYFGAPGGSNPYMIMQIIDQIVFAQDEGDDTQPPVRYTPYQQSGSLVIRTTEEHHSQIADLLTQLRKLNDLMITIEVRYVTLRDSYAEKMGVDFDINFTNGNARARYNGDTTGSAKDAFNGKTTVGQSLPGTITSNFDVPVSQDSYSLAQPTFGSAAGLTSAGASLGFAILSDIETYFFISAAQNNIRSNVMEAPRVTLFNGQYGSVSDSTQRPFVTSVEPVVSDFAAAYQPVITILHEGNILHVQGTVSSDRRFVKLTLNPVFSVIDKVETYKYMGSDEYTEDTEESSAIVKGDNDTNASTDEKARATRSRTSQGVTIQQPVISQFSINTTVNVPDGGTIVMGGIKRLSEGRSEYGTPMLSKIPYLNRLFMNTAIGRDTSSTMMVVTPRIIIQEEEEAAIGYTP